MEQRAGYLRSVEGSRELLVSELRAARVTLQSRADGKKIIKGYSAVFYNGDPGTEYWLWDDIVERIMPGAFDKVLGDDARALFNHNPDNLLGRVSAKTCRIGSDSTGLWYEVDEDEADPDWQRVARKIDRGDLTGSSFAFIPKRSTWVEEEDYWVRQIEEMAALFDVGPVTYPAYSGTTAGRSTERPETIFAELERHKRQRIDAANEVALAQVRARLCELDG